MLELSIVTSLYRGATYLPAFFEQLATQSIFEDSELVLVHNDPTDEELSLVNAFDALYPGKLNHIIVEREPLARSWNRGWQAARSEVIAIWNVDDQREPDSLENQYSDILNGFGVYSYGDFIEVSSYGSKTGKRRHTPEFEQAHFLRSFAGGGAFMVFSKSLAEQVGYFDESLVTASDFDFSVRVAMCEFTLCKTPGILGYFTNTAEGLSTRDDVSAVERTVLQLRYAIYDKVRWEYQDAAEAYALDEIEILGEKQALSRFIPNLDEYRAERISLWQQGRFRNVMRSALRKLGVLRFVYWLQDKFIQREL